MDKTFKKTEAVIKYETYEMFATYRRPKSMKIKEYVTEFQKRLKKITDVGCVLPDCVIAYTLLQSADLTDTQEQLLKATCKMTYEDLANQMKKIFIKDIQGSSEVRVKEEPIDFVQQDTLYGKYKNINKNDRWNKNESKYRKEDFSKQRSDDAVKKQSKKRGNNPLDQYGRITRCINCDSVNHWVKDCPDFSDKEHDTYLLNYKPEDDNINESTF